MPSRMLIDLVASIKSFYRSPSSMFWTFAFPIILMLIFGAIFSAEGTGAHILHVQNLDGDDATGHTQALLDAMAGSGAMELVMVDPSADLDLYIQERSPVALMVIPSGFGADVISDDAVLTFRMDQSSQSAQVLLALVGGTVNHLNLAFSGGSESMTIQTGSIVDSTMSYIDFFLPGVIGLTVMNNSVNYVASIMCDYRGRGIFRKLMTTPLTRAEWLGSQIAWQMILNTASVLLISAIGVVVFGMSISLGLRFWALIIISSALFTALGMLLGGLIRDQDSAGSAAMAITFPMMFLSGSFFALEMMPSYLQSVATALPLTYLNNGLRDAMIFGNLAGADLNILILLAWALALMTLASLVTRWKAD